jgi:hypothetical protein
VYLKYGFSCVSQQKLTRQGRDALSTLEPSQAASLHRVQWIEDDGRTQTVLLEFQDPQRRKAVVDSTPLDSPPAPPAGLHADVLEIITAPLGLNNDARWRDGLQAWIGKTAQDMVTIKIQDAQVWAHRSPSAWRWRLSRPSPSP